MSRMKKTILTSIVSTLLVFSSFGHTKEPTNGSEKYSIESTPRRQCKAGLEWSALLEKNDGIWRVNDVSQAQQKRISDTQEILCVNLQTKGAPAISIGFEELGTITKAGYFECTLLLKKSGYTPCNSSLTKTSAFGTVGKNVAAAVLTLGLAAGTNKVFDSDEIKKAIDESDLITKIQEEEYRFLFSSARSVADFQAFIQRYADNDPDNLVSRASAEIERIRPIEEAKQAEDARIAEEKKKEWQRQEKEWQRERIAMQESERKIIDDFRAELKIETETNCGPVLEIKGRLVKVYFPLSTYGNEHWIRKEELFPPSYECKFHVHYITPTPRNF